MIYILSIYIIFKIQYFITAIFEIWICILFHFFAFFGAFINIKNIDNNIKICLKNILLMFYV